MNRILFAKTMGLVVFAASLAGCQHRENRVATETPAVATTHVGAGMAERQTGFSFAIFQDETLIDRGQLAPVAAENAHSEPHTLAAAALLRVLQDRGVNLDASVMPYLPVYWNKYTFAPVTFRELLWHHAGVDPQKWRKDRWAAFGALAAGYGFDFTNQT